MLGSLIPRVVRDVCRKIPVFRPIRFLSEGARNIRSLTMVVGRGARCGALAAAESGTGVLAVAAVVGVTTAKLISNVDVNAVVRGWVPRA